MNYNYLAKIGISSIELSPMFIQLQTIPRREIFDESNMISHLWNVVLVCSFGDYSCQKGGRGMTTWKKNLHPKRNRNVYLIPVKKNYKSWLKNIRTSSIFSQPHIIKHTVGMITREPVINKSVFITPWECNGLRAFG